MHAELTAVQQKVLEVAREYPGVEPLDAIADGRLPYAHQTVKRAAAALRADGLLWPSRPAWLLLSPKGREWAQGHPCETRCWRIGGAVTLEHGLCPECGQVDFVGALTDVERAIFRAIVEHGPLLQSDFMLHHAQDIAETTRKQTLVSLRKMGWLSPWNGLVATTAHDRQVIKEKA